MRTDSKLGVVHKSIRLRLILPEGREGGKTLITAPAGKVFTGANVLNVLDKAAAKIEGDYPLWEFRLVQVGPAAYNFIYAGVRENWEEIKEAMDAAAARAKIPAPEVGA